MTIVSTIKGEQIITGSLGVGQQSNFTFNHPGQRTIDLSGSLIIRHSGSNLLSPTGSAVIFYDRSLQRLRVSQNGTASVDLISTSSGGLTGSFGINVGAGQGLFKGKSDLATLQFRSLLAGSGIGLLSGSDTVTISYTGSTGISQIFGSNEGALGESIFQGTLGTDTLKFRKIIAGTNIALFSGSDAVTIASSPVTGTNVGLGEGIFQSTNGTNTLRFRKLLPGTNITIVSGSDNITINATVSGLTSSAGVNSGSGQGVYKGNSDAGTLQFRSLRAGTNMVLVSGSQDITFNNPLPEQVYTIDLGVSSAGTIITTGSKGFKTIPISGTIVGYSVVANPSASVTLHLWKKNAALPNSGDKITTDSPPPGGSAIAFTGSYYSSANFFSWGTTMFAANDVVMLHVERNDLATYLLISLAIRRS